ncbi:MAG: hypothetical protein J0L82_00490 [Deltaproteobacteria bacterium]|jgi:purine-cytosine permease-like protein|nr:hypothetical protein [Deltaproteobacteria bacterium]
MIHAILAGMLCTTALLIAAFEHFKGDRKSGSIFFLVYGIGTMGWTAAGIIADSTPLVVISSAQTAAAISCAWLSYINDSSVEHDSQKCPNHG